MKAFATLLALTTLSTSVFATSVHRSKVIEKMVCNFTEPFILLEVDTASKLVKINSANDGISMARIGTVYDSGRRISITFGADQVLLIDKKTKGSDGMSDKIYHVTGTLQRIGDSKNTLIGGCDIK
ncbi:MAG: hypothetical protein ACK5P5_05610 [Pseudobdellovibrionaceae bacterium]